MATTNSIRCQQLWATRNGTKKNSSADKLEVGYARGMSRDLNCKGEAEVGQASQSDTGGTTDENQKIEVKKVDQELKMTHIEALSRGDAVKLELAAVKEFPALDSFALDKVVQYHCMATFDPRAISHLRLLKNNFLLKTLFFK